MKYNISSFICLFSIVFTFFSCENEPNPVENSVVLDESFLDGNWKLAKFVVNNGSLQVNVDNGEMDEFEAEVNYNIDNTEIIALDSSMNKVDDYTLRFNIENQTIIESETFRLVLDPITTSRVTGGVTTLLPDSGIFLTYENERINSKFLMENDDKAEEEFSSLFNGSSAITNWNILNSNTISLNYETSSGVQSLNLNVESISEDLIRLSYISNDLTPNFGGIVLDDQFVSGFNDEDGNFVTVVTFSPVQNNFTAKVSITLERL